MYKKLKARRVGMGITCREMATLLNKKTRAAYSKKERGDVPITINEAIAIVRKLNTTLNDIFL